MFGWRIEKQIVICYKKISNNFLEIHGKLMF